MGCCNNPPEAPPPGTPGALRQAAQFGLALVRFAAGGFRPVSEADYQARMAACDACPFQKPKGACAACGCVLAIKARMPVEHCPHARWPALTS